MAKTRTSLAATLEALDRAADRQTLPGLNDENFAQMNRKAAYEID
jgi:hypothetical protein